MIFLDLAGFGDIRGVTVSFALHKELIGSLEGQGKKKHIGRPGDAHGEGEGGTQGAQGGDKGTRRTMGGRPLAWEDTSPPSASVVTPLYEK